MIVSRLRDGCVIRIGTGDSSVLAHVRKRAGRFEIAIIAPSTVPVLIDQAKPGESPEAAMFGERISHAVSQPETR